MKKKIITIFLMIMFIPGIFMFAGCKDDGYKLENLNKDYESIADNCENIKIVDNKLVFNYDNFTVGKTKYLTDAIENFEPYTNLKNYNILLDNLMGFVYENIDLCANKNIDASASVRNNIKADLDNFAESVYEIDVYINQWAEVVEFNYDVENKSQITNSQCLSRFKTLLVGYNNLYQRSISLSNSLSDLYYNYALNDANPRIDNVKLSDFNASVVVSKLQGRVKYEISNISQLFVEIYIDGTDLPTQLTTPTIINEGKDDEQIIFNSLGLTKTGFDYIAMVNDLNRAFGANFDAETIVEIANGESVKQDFYDLSVRAYNLQNILDNDNSLFVDACRSVEYSNINNVDVDEKRSKEVIDNYKFIVNEYKNVLSEMLDCVNL